MSARGAGVGISILLFPLRFSSLSPEITRSRDRSAGLAPEKRLEIYSRLFSLELMGQSNKSKKIAAKHRKRMRRLKQKRLESLAKKKS